MKETIGKIGEIYEIFEKLIERDSKIKGRVVEVIERLCQIQRPLRYFFTDSTIKLSDNEWKGELKDDKVIITKGEKTLIFSFGYIDSLGFIINGKYYDRGWDEQEYQIFSELYPYFLEFLEKLIRHSEEKVKRMEELAIRIWGLTGLKPL